MSQTYLTTSKLKIQKISQGSAQKKEYEQIFNLKPTDIEAKTNSSGLSSDSTHGEEDSWLRNNICLFRGYSQEYDAQKDIQDEEAEKSRLRGIQDKQI